jgi:hypothetical protein
MQEVCTYSHHKRENHSVLVQYDLFRGVNYVCDEFLKALYRMSDGGYKIIEMYIVGKDIGIPNTQVDDIVNDLSNMGLIKKIGETKILLTFEGKQKVESSKQIRVSMSCVLISMLIKMRAILASLRIVLSYRKLTCNNISYSFMQPF